MTDEELADRVAAAVAGLRPAWRCPTCGEVWSTGPPCPVWHPVAKVAPEWLARVAESDPALD